MSQQHVPATTYEAESAAPPLRQRDHVIGEWREHWPTGVATMIGLGLGLSILPNILGLFIAPLQQAFGWTRGQIALAQNSSLLGAIAAPIAGRLVDRFGTRFLIVSGFATMTVFFIALAAMHGALSL